MFGINELNEKVDHLLKKSEYEAINVDKIIFTLSEINDNLIHLINKFDQVDRSQKKMEDILKKKEKPKTTRKKEK